jgi:hypothetical protein
MNFAPDSFVPSKDAQKVLLEGFKEIVGPHSARELFSRSCRSSAESTATSLDELQRLLVDQFGPLGGCGVALRSGRAAFRHGLRKWGTDAGITSIDYRLLPLNRRIFTGLERLAAILTERCGLQVSTSQDEQHWYWRVDPYLNTGLQPTCPACYMVIGVLQEFMAWAAGGRSYPVREVSCHCTGADACLFQIEKKALD